MPDIHEVKINLVDGKVRPQIANPMRVGDTVHYTSDAGKARVNFPAGSPFAVTQVFGGETHTIVNPGTFTCQCFLEIGWSPEDPDAGGDHDVIPTH
jgi:hypothetical protein